MMVSVIVPVYNAAPYLSDCIESILRQTCLDIELILIDDGSTDDSPAICDNYAAKCQNVTVIHQTNQGLSGARNTGIKRAKGEYVTFVDADDMIHPNFIKVLTSNVGNSDIIICRHTRGYKCDWHEISPNPTYREIGIRQAIISTLYQQDIDNSACKRLIRTGLLRKNLFKENLWYEDMDLTFRLYADIKSPIRIVDEALYFYRDTPKSFTNTFSRQRLDVLKVTSDLEKRYAEDPEILKAAQDRRFSANFNMYVLTRRANMMSEAQECWRYIVSKRTAELLNPQVRIKNKCGALLSFLGQPITMLVSKLMY